MGIGLLQLFYTKSFADADSDQAAFSVTIMFGVGLLVYWPVPLILWLTEVEIWSVQTAPWPFLIGSVSSSLGKNSCSIFFILLTWNV